MNKGEKFFVIFICRSEFALIFEHVIGLCIFTFKINMILAKRGYIAKPGLKDQQPKQNLPVTNTKY